MTIAEAASLSNDVIEGIERDYHVGYINEEYPDGDQVELTANGVEDLQELWESLCKEFETEPDSVTYVWGVPFDPWQIEAAYENGLQDVFTGFTKEEVMKDIAYAENWCGKCLWTKGVDNEVYSDGKYVGPYDVKIG